MCLKINLVGKCFLVGLLFISHSLWSQDWELKDEEDGIKVYTRPVENSDIKAIKVDCIVEEATLSQLAAVILDIPASDQWVYATKLCRTEKIIAPGEFIYYSEIEVPWPASNRDFIVRVKVEQDSATRKMTVGGENLPTYLNEKEGIIRVMHTESQWTVIPYGNDLKIEFVLHVNPGGSIPAWLINLFATRGPMETFLNLRSQIRKPQYRDASFPFLVD